MLDDRRQGDVEWLRQVARRSRPAAQTFDEPPPRGNGERVEDWQPGLSEPEPLDATLSDAPRAADSQRPCRAHGAIMQAFVVAIRYLFKKR